MDGRGGENRVPDWSEIEDGPLQAICNRSDPIFMSRMSYSVRDLCHSLERVTDDLPSFPYDLPCLLHSNPFTWPNDKSVEGRVIEASLMPLDGPSMPAPIILPEQTCR